jgi:hypothetical protein
VRPPRCAFKRAHLRFSMDDTGRVWRLVRRLPVEQMALLAVRGVLAEYNGPKRVTYNCGR